MFLACIRCLTRQSEEADRCKKPFKRKLLLLKNRREQDIEKITGRLNGVKQSYSATSLLDSLARSFMWNVGSFSVKYIHTWHWTTTNTVESSLSFTVFIKLHCLHSLQSEKTPAFIKCLFWSILVEPDSPLMGFRSGPGCRSNKGQLRDHCPSLNTKRLSSRWCLC